MHDPCLQGEGPSIFKPSDGNYYMMASHLTYWKPNPPMLYHAAAASLPTAKWNKLATPAMGDTANTTHNSQSSSVFQLQLQDGSSMFIYMGDRWNFYGPGSVSFASVHVPCICSLSPRQLSHQERAKCLSVGARCCATLSAHPIGSGPSKRCLYDSHDK